MNWQTYFGPERRNQQRYSVSIDVEFYLWDPMRNVPLTDKTCGRLVNISPKGACLLSNTARLGNHHLVMSCGLGGENLLMIELNSFPEEFSWKLKSKIAWYKMGKPEDRFKFEFGIEFLEICRESGREGGEEQEEALLVFNNYYKEED